jgi:hypothetical protein
MTLASIRGKTRAVLRHSLHIPVANHEPAILCTILYCGGVGRGCGVGRGLGVALGVAVGVAVDVGVTVGVGVGVDSGTVLSTLRNTAPPVVPANA